jgi:hypothetical protein
MNTYETMAMRKITLYFTILCALFLMLSSQFTGFIMPLLFVFPIYMGLTGIKRRRKSGYLIGMAIIPLAFAISILWIRYSISVFNDRTILSKISTDYSISVNSAGMITTTFFLLSILMISLSVIVFVKLRKNRELFT